MDFRSISKVFVFTKSLRNHNKYNGINLSLTQLYILYAVHVTTKGMGCTIKNIDATLKANFHTCSRNKIKDCLKDFISKEWVNVVEKNPTRYRVTIPGINLLGELERKVRIGRIKKPN